MKTFLFLDIDGVLNSNEFLRAQHDLTGSNPRNLVVSDETVRAMISPEMVLNLQAICEALHSEESPLTVVLSSTWRKFRAEKNMLRRALWAYGLKFPVNHETPTVVTGGGDRGDEILAWLNAHVTEPCRVLILDDDSDAGHGTVGFFQTSWNIGLAGPTVVQDALAKVAIFNPKGR